MPPLTHLTRAAYGIHFADQIALVSVPLIAAIVFDASPQVIGLLVACQSMAHLIGSLPFGVLVDKAQQRSLAVGATLISLLGFAGAGISVALGSLVMFAASITVAGFGVVLFVLTTLSILPKTLTAQQLSAANASIELPRALASFLVPLAVGLAINGTLAYWIFPIAALTAATACATTRQLPEFAVTPNPDRQSILRKITDGGSFVLRHPLLRAISLCAIFWNFAFAALLVTMVPLIRDVYGVAPGTFGIALAAFGLGAIAGTWASKRFGHLVAPRLVLLFGPGVSALAAVLLYLLPSQSPLPALYIAFFCIGFGPAMWLIAQNSVRQIVSPHTMLGRVNAVIQTAIYGIRPLAAIISGLLVGATSPQTGLMLVAVCFTLSFAAAACSGLRRIENYADLSAPA